MDKIERERRKAEKEIKKKIKETRNWLFEGGDDIGAQRRSLNCSLVWINK